MSIEKLAGKLSLDSNGIWVSCNQEELSYPEEGNTNSFKVEHRSFWYGHRNALLGKLLKNFSFEGTFLDVGGGNGFVAKGLIEHGFDAALLEPSAAGALNGKLHNKIPTVLCSTLQDAGFLDESIGAIGSFDVIEHIEDHHAFVKAVHKVLKPGGLFVATVPAHQYLWSMTDNRAGHYRRYNKEMVEALLKDDFEILYFTHFFSVLMLPFFLFRTLPYWCGTSSKKEPLSREKRHGAKGGLGMKLLRYFLKREIDRVSQLENHRYGTSCLWVARKKA